MGYSIFILIAKNLQFIKLSSLLQNFNFLLLIFVIQNQDTDINRLIKVNMSRKTTHNVLITQYFNKW